MATNAELLVLAYREMGNLMLQDLKAGHKWRYSNNGAKRAKSFPQARSQGKYYIQCAEGAHWGCKYLGVPGKALAWFGRQGGTIAWCASTAQREAKKYFTFIKIGGKKTVKQLIDAGTLKPGDMITYMSMTHTNAYLGNNKSFDTGHAYCTGSGEEAVFKRFVGSLVCKSYKVSYIIRIREDITVTIPKFETVTIPDVPMPTTNGWWVQCGAYTTIPAAREAARRLTRAGFKIIWNNTPEYYRIQCGQYQYYENAVKKVQALKRKGFNAIIKEI